MCVCIEQGCWSLLAAISRRSPADRALTRSSEQKRPTCRSWGPSAPSSACPRGRRRRRPRRPLRRSRPSRTERCCPTAAGRAVGGGRGVTNTTHSELLSFLEAASAVSLSLSLSYLGHKVVPHAELGGDELLPVRGSLGGHGGRRGRRLLHRASGNQHPHVEPAPVAVHVLSRGLRGGGWVGQRRCVPSKTASVRW